MKARLLGLLFLCCGLLFAISLMVDTEAVPVPDSSISYIQSMALPPPAPCGHEEPSGLKAVPVRENLPEGENRETVVLGTFEAPKQTLPYYELAYYAFHFSDEAG